ncbi:MAG: hypothetical protein LCH73_13575 [Proteobacteria bacterium]|nr:hypothetical protein [Pseudomonadota bacterium]
MKPSSVLLAGLVACAAAAGAAAQSGGVFYQCPGPEFTNTISARDAQAKGCKPMEVQVPVTIAAPRARAASGQQMAAASAARSAEMRVDVADQRARDTDARRILETELRNEQGQLDALRKDYNDGEPERRGDERNYQKYQDRVADMKAAISRKEADVAAIKRELGKL